VVAEGGWTGGGRARSGFAEAASDLACPVYALATRIQGGGFPSEEHLTSVRSLEGDGGPADGQIQHPSTRGTSAHVVGGLAGGGKGALIGGLLGAGAGTAGAALTGNKDITVPAESVVTFKLAEPITVTRSRG